MGGEDRRALDVERGQEVDERLLVLRVGRQQRLRVARAEAERARAVVEREHADPGAPERAHGGEAVHPADVDHDRGFHRGQQLLDRRAGQPASRVRIGAAALAGEHPAAQAQRDEQQAPRALGLAPPAVLVQEADVAAHLLAEHRAPALLRRRPAHVHELRVRREEHLPARLAEAVEPIRLLAEHEEVLVEEANRIGGLAPHEQDRAHQELRLVGLVVREAVAVEGVEGPRARRELAQEEVLGREPPEGREAAHRALQPAVRVAQLRADDRRLGMRLAEGDQPLERAFGRPGVRVQEQEPVARGDPHAGVRAAAEALVLLLDQRAPRGSARAPARACRRSSRGRRRSSRGRARSRAPAPPRAARCR